MTHPPAKEIIDFPHFMALKAIGVDEGDFIRFVVEAVRTYVPNLQEAGVTFRPSSGGKYIAVSVPFWAESRAQLDAIYGAISQDARVKVVL